MRYSLTICFCTSRLQAHSGWFFTSLRKQIWDNEQLPDVIVVDSNLSRDRFPHGQGYPGRVRNVLPKPTIWQGEHKIIRDEIWAKSNALNTSIALCETNWWSWVDDRVVLGPHWLQSIREAMDKEYTVCGSYEKRANMRVEGGEIIDAGQLLGEDHRQPQDRPIRSKDFYGGSGALPLEWALDVNGWSEDVCDSLGLEDAMFGMTLYNSGFDMCYDGRMKIIEDRTPGQLDGALKRADFGSTPEDKSHAIVNRLENSKTSQNSYNLRELRERVLAGEPWPIPTASRRDWWDDADIPTKFNALT